MKEILKIFSKSPKTVPRPDASEKEIAENPYEDLRDALVLYLTSSADRATSPLLCQWANIIDTYDMALVAQADDSPRYIGVYGSPKMGKSTLLNSIVGENILPEAPIPKTGSVIDLIRDDSRTDYIIRCRQNDYSDLSIESRSTVEKVREYLNRRAGQDTPCDKVEVIGPFKNALPIFTENSILRDTPGAEAEASQAKDERLKEDSEKTKHALESTHIPIFCVSQETLQEQQHKKFYDKYFKNKECIHVITRCDDSEEHEKFTNLFSRHFGITDDAAHRSITCTGMSNIESKKVDINLAKLYNAINDYLDIKRIRKRLVVMAEEICRTPELFNPRFHQVHIECIKDALKTIKNNHL